MAGIISGALTQDAINKQYGDWRAGNPTKSGQDAFDYGTSLGLTNTQLSSAGMAYNKTLADKRQTTANTAYATSAATRPEMTDPAYAGWEAQNFKNAQGLGVNVQEYSNAQDAYNKANVPAFGGKPAPAPLAATPTTPAAGNNYWNGGQAANAEQMATARAWAKGKTGAELAAKGKEMNLSADQFASVFGNTGAEATGVGYGTTQGISASSGAFTWDGEKWVKPEAAAPTTPAAPPPAPPPTTPPAGGIIASAGPTTYQAKGVQTTDDMTVEGRMARLMNPNDPRNQQLATRQKEIANGRGVLNSSMGDTMIQDSIIRNAADIAGKDATMTAENARFTAGAENTAGQFNADAANVLNRMSVQQQQDLAKMATAQGYNLQSMSAQQVNDLAKIAAGQKNNLETLSTQFGFDLQKMDKSIAATLGQMSVQQQNDIAKMAKAQGYNMESMGAQQLNDLQKMSTAQDYLKSNIGTQQSFDLAKMDKAAAITLGQMDKQQLNNLATMAKQHGYNLETLTAQQAGALANIGAQANVSERLAALNIDAQKALNLDNQTFQKALTSSAQMQGILGNLQTQIAAAQRDPNITDPTAKQNIVTDLANIARASLSVVGNAPTDVDVTSLMNQLFPKK